MYYSKYEIEKSLKDNLLEMRLKIYSEFKDSNTYGENFKSKSILELSAEFTHIREVTEKNILTVIDRLIDINSAKELLVDEISLCNLKKYAALNTKDAFSRWNTLLDKKLDLIERIDKFIEMTIEEEKEFTKVYNSDFYIELDSISYILSAFYFREYLFYREDYLNKFLQLFNIEMFSGSYGEIYEQYLSLANIILDTLKSLNLFEKPSILDVEDFICFFVDSEKLRVERVDFTLEDERDYLEAVDFTRPLDFDSLYFEDSEILKIQIESALKSGKSIILIGPPGTGKSKLAKKVSSSFGVDSKMVTAMSSWSSYDTIGGYKPSDDGRLYFEEGIFLSCLKDRYGRNRNQWLIIDEINRADIDKAFGPFLSTLSGDDIELGLKDRENRNIELVLERNLDIVIQSPNKYIVPRDFRIIGTMNTLDKTSLYEMSYAFMRRFAFIPVGIPRNIDKKVVKELCIIWNTKLKEDDYEKISKLWVTINLYRKIGPSIIEDISKFIELGGDYISAIVVYIIPQLEGLFDERIEGFVESIISLGFTEDGERLKNYVEDFFNIALTGK